MFLMTTEAAYKQIDGERPMQIAKIDYRDGLAMYVFLPREIVMNPFSILEEPISGILKERRWIKPSKLHITMPKFSHEYEINLVKQLLAMGMTEAFSDKAEFTGISNLPVYFSDGIHKATIDVDEEGTVATASTAMYARTSSSPIPRREPEYRFTADRPFGYIIRDTVAKVTLFTGVVRKF